MFTCWRTSLDYVITIEFMSKTSILFFILSMHYWRRMLLGHGVMRLKKLSTHSKKSFQSSPFWEGLISTRSSFYTLTRVLLVLKLFLANLMKRARNMLSPMHFEATTRLRTTTLHTRGSALLLYGPSYILGPIFMAPISLCIPTTSLSNGWWPMINLLVS